MTLGEVFIKTHTKKDGSFVDKKAQKVAEAYQQNKQANLTDFDTANSETSDGTSRPPQPLLDKDNEHFLLLSCFFYLGFHVLNNDDTVVHQSFLVFFINYLYDFELIFD